MNSARTARTRRIRADRVLSIVAESSTPIIQSVTPNQEPLLLQAIDEAYNRSAWHGPNLRGALRGVSAADAPWRPSPDRHNIWEEAVHCAYWKYAARRRIVGAKRGSFTLAGSNWFVRPEAAPPADAAWKADLRLLDEQHGLLREAVAAFCQRGAASPADLRLVRGIAFHDVYHAGQIQLLKRLRRG
jgi:hypothetical protein